MTSPTAGASGTSSATPFRSGSPLAAILRTALRVSAAALVLAGGFIHYGVWQQQYKDLPPQVPGRWVVRTGFPVNVASSLLLAVGLIAVGLPLFARLHRLVVLGALALEAGSIAILVTTRYRAVFGWLEKGDWGTDPKRALVVEILAVVALLTVLVVERVRPGGDHPVANRP